MNRAERQHALLDWLRANAERAISVRRLADRFEVSTRTIERDIRALQAAGVPIYGEPGRRGGYAVSRGYSLPPISLTEPEIIAVLTGLTVAAGSPLANEARAARYKIVAVLPPDRREAASTLGRRVAALAPEPATDQWVSQAVREVLLRPRVVQLTYRDPESGSVTQRTVEPLGLITVRGNWILTGWCRLRESVRGFRTDAITSLTVTDEAPPDRQGDPLAEDLARWRFLTDES